MLNINLAELDEDSIKLLLEAAAKEQNVRYQEKRAAAILDIQKLMKEFDIQAEELNKSIKVKKRHKGDAVIAIPLQADNGDILPTSPAPVVESEPSGRKKEVVQEPQLFDED